MMAVQNNHGVLTGNKMTLAKKISEMKHIKGNIFKETEPVFISTGSLPINILFSGQLDGGIQVGKISMIAAPSSLGKSFVGMKVAKNAQTQHNMTVIIMDTEFAYSPTFARSVGVNEDELFIIQENQIEEIQQKLVSTMMELDDAEKEKTLIIIDSWGGMITSKTTADAVSGKDVTDMTISKKKNSLARLLTGLGCTVFVINQTYETMDQYNPLAVGGGRGIRFASSAIVMGTSKAKSKDGTDIDGVIVSAKVDKGRLAVENSKLKYMIKFEGGIHPYYGILDDALEGEFVVKPSMGWYTRPCVPDDKKWREKEIWERSKEFWSPVFTDTEFKQYIEKKYSFKHNIITNDELHLD